MNNALILSSLLTISSPNEDNANQSFFLPEENGESTSKNSKNKFTLDVKKIRQSDIRGASFKFSIKKSKLVIGGASYFRGISGEWSPSAQNLFVRYTTGSDQMNCDVYSYTNGHFTRNDIGYILNKSNNTSSIAKNIGIKENYGNSRYYLDCDKWIDDNRVAVSLEIDHKKEYSFYYELNENKLKYMGKKNIPQ